LDARLSGNRIEGIAVGHHAFAERFAGRARRELAGAHEDAVVAAQAVRTTTGGKQAESNIYAAN
jgi:hypothetical protein